MRPATHTVELPGGRLVLPLTFQALRLLGAVVANPVKPEDGCVCPAKVCLGSQDLSALTMLECFHALAGTGSPGLEKLFGYGTQADLVHAFAAYCRLLVGSMGPEAPPPKA